MKAHARSITLPLPVITYLESGHGDKRHDSVQSALRYVHDNHAVRNVKLKPYGQFNQAEIWAESMVTGEPIFMGVLEKES